MPVDSVIKKIYIFFQCVTNKKKRDQTTPAFLLLKTDQPTAESGRPLRTSPSESVVLQDAHHLFGVR